MKRSVSSAYEEMYGTVERSLFIDLLQEGIDRAREAPAEFLSEIASFVGACLAEVPAERLEICLESIATHEDPGMNPLLRTSMRTIVPWARAEVACARELERTFEL